VFALSRKGIYGICRIELLCDGWEIELNPGAGDPSNHTYIPIIPPRGLPLPSNVYFTYSTLSCIEISAAWPYGGGVNSNRIQLAETIAELRKQQLDVLKAAKLGDITDDEVAAYYALDLEIRYLADEMHREDSPR